MGRILLQAIFLLSAITSMAQKPSHPEMLVSTQWLATHLHDNHLILIQIGPELSAYEAGHIPGALFLANKDVFFEHAHGFPIDRLIAQFRSLGVTENSRIVIYSAEYPTLSTRLYWMLDYLGIAANASLLDGGLDKWTSEHRELSRESAKASEQGDIRAHPNAYVLAELSDVANIGADSVLIDSRPRQRYIEGHIPGAILSYWQDMTDTDSKSTFLEPSKLAKLYAEIGLKKDKKLITYCDAGFQATHSYFTLIPYPIPES
jgi:thiosulfate/3-mercaptopyruvate sulfurtransferase